MNEQNGNQLANQTVILEVIFHKPGMTRRGDLSLVETEADKRQLGLSKRIIESPEYKEVGLVASHCRAFLRNLELAGPFKTGRHLLTLPLLESAYRHVGDAEVRYAEAAERFLAVYPSQVEQAKTMLADQYRAEDYPAVDTLREAFRVEKRVTTWSTPDASQIGEYLYSQEKARAAVELAAIADDAKLALREGIKALAAKLAKALGYKDSGHRQTLTPATYQKVADWLAIFDKRDVMNDSDLGAVVTEIKAALEGKGLDDLRTNRGVRDEVRRNLDGAIERLDTLLVDAPSRVVSFEDEV